MASRTNVKGQALKPGEFTDLLDELDKRIDRCKVLFEQYFLGIQRLPPYTLQKDLERRIRELTQNQIPNTGNRFRFTTLSQKFASYNTYWKRTMRRIENGSYVRDVAKVGRNAIRTGKDVPDEVLAKMPKRMRDRILRDREALANREERRQQHEAADLDAGKVRNNTPANVHSLNEADLLEDLDLDSIFASMTSGSEATEAAPAPAPAPRAAAPQPTPTPTPQKAAPPRPAAKRPPPSPPQRPAAKAAPPVKPPPGMSVSEGQALYKRYKKARELIGEKTDNLSYDKLMRSLNKQAPKIMDQHKAKGVSFNVVVKGDRVVLKAKPKKE